MRRLGSRAILSAAMLLRHSLGLEAEAKVIEESVAGSLRLGYRTADIAAGENRVKSTTAMGDAILEQMEKLKIPGLT